MPARDERERWRYIAFKIEGDAPFARNDFLGSFLHAVKGTPLYDAFRITVFEGDFGIIKVKHILKDEAIKALSAMDSVKGRPCRVVTLSTSGTIKTLKEKYRARISGRSSQASD